jgi:Protein of unknown function (DUF998)
MYLKKFRMLQVVFSTVIFFAIFLYFFFTTNFKFTDIQLSYWGSKSSHPWIWNASLITLSISMVYNVYTYINSFNNLVFKNLIILFFISLNASLFLVGLFSMRYYIHNILAVYYFFGYPLAIFLFAHFNYSKIPVRVWKINLIFSIMMVVLPLSVIKFFHGMAISETIHSMIMIGWNYWIIEFGGFKKV